MQGRVIDKFCASSEATAYLTARQKEGAGDVCMLLQTVSEVFLHAGCTRLVWGGHTSVPTEHAAVGWHGEEGYRRNTFDLRARHSVFDYEGNTHFHYFILLQLTHFLQIPLRTPGHCTPSANAHNQPQPPYG